VNFVDPEGTSISALFNGLMCLYYEYSVADDRSECEKEYGKACGSDLFSESCMDFCSGEPSYPSDDVNKCVGRKNPDGFRNMMKWCFKAAVGFGTSGTGARP